MSGARESVPRPGPGCTASAGPRGASSQAGVFILGDDGCASRPWGAGDLSWEPSPGGLPFPWLDLARVTSEVMPRWTVL